MTPQRALGVAFLTGFAGLGSESLHLKLLDHVVGSSATTAHVVTSVFVLGLGLGATLGRLVPRPAWVEGALFVHHAALAWLLPAALALNAAVLSALVPVLGPTLGATVVGMAYVLPPALMLGVTFPAVAESSQNPARCYAAQALGAVLGLVVIDGAAYPMLGVVGALGCLAAVHLAAATLLGTQSYERASSRPAAALAHLVVVGAATGALQGVWLVLAPRLFKPYFFVQPAVIGAFLIGLFAGSRAWLRGRWSPSVVLTACALGAALSAVGAAIVARASPLASPLAMVSATVVVLAPTTVPIGALFPAFVGAEPSDRGEVGATFFGLAAGNAVGLLTAPLVLLTFFSEPVALVALVSVLLALGVAARPRGAWALRVVAALGAVGAAAAMQERALMLRATPDRSIATVEASFRRFGEVSAVLVTETGAPPGGRAPPTRRRLYQNGRCPVALDHNMESVITFVGAAYAPRAERALVLGAGSGRSAGTAARLFDAVDVVDIGETTPELLTYLAAENGHVLERDGVTLHRWDAVLAPHALPSRYDLVVMTVDPAFVAVAAKLYTVEALTALGTMLRPGGVLVFWSDGYLDLEANQILVNTAGAVFEHQKLISVADPARSVSPYNYYLVVGSASPLTWNATRTRGAEPDRFARDLLDAGEPARLVAPRFHPTERLHGLSRPAWPVLVSGYRYALGPENR